MAHCVIAGMSLSDFYEAEGWEINAILRQHFSIKEQEYKTDWERARLIAGSMVGSDKIKFPWDDEISKADKERIERAMKIYEKWDNTIDKRSTPNE